MGDLRRDLIRLVPDNQCHRVWPGDLTEPKNRPFLQEDDLHAHRRTGHGHPRLDGRPRLDGLPGLIVHSDVLHDPGRPCSLPRCAVLRRNDREKAAQVPAVQFAHPRPRRVDRDSSAVQMPQHVGRPRRVEHRHGTRQAVRHATDYSWGDPRVP